MDKRLSTAIAIVVTGAWAVSFILDAVIPTYDPPATLHALMMLVVGAAVGNMVSRKREEEA